MKTENKPLIHHIPFFYNSFRYTDTIYQSLKRRAEKLAGFLNTLDGMTCNRSEGAMYLFPQVRLPAKAIEEAKRLGKVPDTYYALQLLENTGMFSLHVSPFFLLLPFFCHRALFVSFLLYPLFVSLHFFFLIHWS
jgi:hypothetical protein